MTFGEGRCDFCHEYGDVVDQGASSICQDCARKAVIAFAAQGASTWAEEMQAARREGVREVHLLVGGRPACGFTEDAPCDWPIGHYWVRGRLDDVTCRHCREAGGE